MTNYIRSLVARFHRQQQGQGMTEYIVIVALIAIAAIGVVTLFGDNLRKLYQAANDALAGETQVKVTTEKAQGHHTKSVGLRGYASNLKGSSQ